MTPDEERAVALENAAIETANQGIKALLLLNGGASIAILGFLANVIGKDLDIRSKHFLEAATNSLVFFSTGAGIAVFLTLLAYLANSAYAGHLQTGSMSVWRFGRIVNWLAIVLSLASLGMFAFGVYEMWLSQQ